MSEYQQWDPQDFIGFTTLHSWHNNYCQRIAQSIPQKKALQHIKLLILTGCAATMHRTDAHQAQEAVCIEDEVGLGGGAVANKGVHAANLEVAGHDLQVVVQALQLWLPQLHLYVLRYQVNSHLILHPDGQLSSLSVGSCTQECPGAAYLPPLPS